MTKLETTQRWLTSIIIRPGRLPDKIAAADKNYRLDNEKVIRSSAQLSAENKISIYARGYVLRLMDCMRADYPVLEKLMGGELFKTFAQAYLVQLPSHSPSLYDLGMHFPAFLKASQPPSAPGNHLFDLPVELAKTERARVEAERSKGLETLENKEDQEEPLFYFLGASAFKTAPCLQLLELQFELLDFIRSVEKGEEAATPQSRHNYLAISRKNYSVNMQELEHWQWQYLQELKNSEDHSAALKQTALKLTIPEDALMADLMLWIPVAVSCGYIYREAVIE